MKKLDKPIKNAVLDSSILKSSRISDTKTRFNISVYHDLLKHPKWQRKRLEIMQRDNFECKCCFSTEIELNVHHFNYAETPWGVKDSELITLCKDCHETYHKLFDNFDARIIARLSDLYMKSANIPNSLD